MDTNLTFTWTEGTASSRMIETFKAHGIAYSEGYYGQLRAKLDGENYVTVDYYHIEGDTFGIVPEPMRTTQKFGKTADELLKKYSYNSGMNLEDWLILNLEKSKSITVPGLKNAVKCADECRKQGYSKVEILQRVRGFQRYEVIAYGPKNA